jgi:hypothetical protein
MGRGYHRHRRRGTSRLLQAVHDFPTPEEGGRTGSVEPSVVPSRNSAPAATTRRPAQPIRPVPATRLAADLLAVKARRRRFQQILPPRAGERGW